MSKSIQIRDVPDDVHRILRTRAAEAGMSLSEYLRREVSRVADRSINAEILLRASTRPGGASHAAVVEAIRAGRDDPDHGG